MLLEQNSQSHIVERNGLDLIGEDDKFFNLHLLMAFNFILKLAGRISLSA
ncbi:hypothetical protein T08_15026 [Trichinella sp. T8]|nr:hypothetical protein T08_15026 [Trichinella sp. T8]